MLSADKIKSNWDKFLAIIDKEISSPRKEKLLAFYKKIEEDVVIAPASSSTEHHSAFPGGYVDHVIRVVEIALDLELIWAKYKGIKNHTREELVFACLNHDLGKMGLLGKPYYLDNDNAWEIKNRNKVYKYNDELPYTSVPDRSLFLLQEAGVPVTINEYIAIKTHDGLYDDANKAYLMTYSVYNKPRTYLPFLIHEADMIAARVEWEAVWADKYLKPKADVPAKETIKEKAIKATIKGDAMNSIMQNIKI